jgi:RNA 3'-terminal phosphate cyclase (ATP)
MHRITRHSQAVCSFYIARRRMESCRSIVTNTVPNPSTLAMEEVVDGTITIDGSLGEGGGQIIRNAISYANILRKPIHIHSIRAGRSRPGLREQHLRGIQLATAICGGALRGDRLNSTEIYYQPENLENISDETKERTITAAVQTAGSICLLLQTALPCALFSPTKIQLYLKGGTNATMAPQYDYWERLFLPTLVEQCKLRPNQIEPTVLKRGYYPKGGGVVKVHVQPIGKRLRPLTMMYRGKLKKIFIYSYHSGDFVAQYATRMANEAMLYLRSRLPNFAYDKCIEQHQDVAGSGSGIIIIATFDCGRQLAGSAIAEYKKHRAKLVGIAAAEELYKTYKDGGCVDEWLQDQLILYAALADGVSEITTGSLTLHTQTAISLAEQMVGAKFEILKLDHLGNPTATVKVPEGYGKSGRIAGKHLIRCHGIGFERKRSVPTVPNHDMLD